MGEENICEKTMDQTPIYDGKVVHLEKWTVELPNGRRATREVVRHVGAVAVVAVDDQGRIAMVRQWRCALGRVLDEIPAGKLDAKTEDHLEAARRELREETGLTAKNWRHLTDMISTPGFCDETISLYLATDLIQGETDFDEDEFLHVTMTPAAALYERVYAGQIQDGKTIGALLLARPYLSAILLN